MGGLVFAWSGVVVMWLFWICFVIFLAQPARLMDWWPLPTIDRGGWVDSTAISLITDAALIALFGLQHSIMARPSFKHLLGMPEPFERCLFVHMANVALFTLILLWQPLPAELWSLPRGWLHDASWALFAAGWVILLLGAHSFGILELLGVRQMQQWADDRAAAPARLKTGLLYRWLQHPMYVGVLIGVWITPVMTAGHMLLAAGLTVYVLIGMRYEERDLEMLHGERYLTWRTTRP